MKRYNPTEIEPKWQQRWASDGRYHASDDVSKQKFYVSGMFPYPSAAGMHIGHAFEHAIVDAIARFQRAHGRNVMNPMGWDAFGLPAENYAIKTGTAPAVVTKQNIENFKNQLNRMGVSIDWTREINTSSPDYYRWTQWVFTEFFKRGLAYQKEAQQWWCPVDKTVLANEQVEAGKCWRCGTEVEKKSMKQWFFKITDYADALLDEIPDLDWPQKIKSAQENWIGRSEGAEIDFRIASSQSSSSETASRPSSLEHPSGSDGAADVSEDEIDVSLTVFTTRPDTIFGATFMVIAPEHPLLKSLVNDETRDVVTKYVDVAIKKSEIERQSEGKEKTGVFTGSYAINPANGEKIPIWVADYVLWGYGTGAIMAVPAHDERDYEFARKYGLNVVQVIAEKLLDQQNPPKEDKKNTERNVVMCVIEHPSDGTFLTLKWNTRPWHNFVMGGLEDDETPETAARREIIEETGYTNMELIGEMPVKLNSSFYAAHKDVNRNIITTVLRFKLTSLETVETKHEAHEDFENLWVERQVLDTLQPLPELAHILRWLDGEEQLYVTEGVLINSGAFDGTPSSEAREEVTAWLEQQGIGRGKVTYKMRDWLISRQRYWGAPIPIIHCPEHGAVPVPEKDLPVVLPEVEDYAPKGDGKSVLARETEWVETTCPTCGKPAKRETDTMDGYACSSWYLLRYTDPQNNQVAWDPKKADYWTPIDMYCGGDHAVAHLLYVRFWSHVFYDMGLVPSKEPVKKLVYHGLIGAEDGRKMSKSLGNVVDPLEVIDQGYGADALRTFELFLGPINENSQWSSRGIAGVYRFLSRAWTLTQEFVESQKEEKTRSASPRTASHLESSGASAPGDSRAVDVARESRDEMAHDSELRALRHRTVKKVTSDIRRLSLNTAIATLMEYVNDLYKMKTSGFTAAWQEPIETLVQLLSVFAPHMSAELWAQLGHDDKLDFAPWPVWDEALTVAESITIVVQVNGKVRSRLQIAKDTSEDEVKALVLADENVLRYLGDKKPTKVIYIPGRLVSVVV